MNSGRKSSGKLSSELGLGRENGWLERQRAFDLELTLEHLVAAGDVQRVETFTAEADVRRPHVLWRAQDGVDPAGLIANLHAERARAVHPPVHVDGDAVGRGVRRVRRGGEREV